MSELDMMERQRLTYPHFRVHLNQILNFVPLHLGLHLPLDEMPKIVDNPIGRHSVLQVHFYESVDEVEPLLNIDYDMEFINIAECGIASRLVEINWLH